MTLVATLALVVELLVAVSGVPASSDALTVSVTNDECGGGMFSNTTRGRPSGVVNTSQRAAEVLLEKPSGGVVAGIAVIGPGTTVDVRCAVGSRPCLDASEEHGFIVDEAEVIY